MKKERVWMSDNKVTETEETINLDEAFVKEEDRDWETLSFFM